MIKDYVEYNHSSGIICPDATVSLSLPVETFYKASFMQRLRYSFSEDAKCAKLLA